MFGEVLGFIDEIGRTNEGYYIYRFDFTTESTVFWGEFFNSCPSSLNPNLTPSKEYISHSGKVILKKKLLLAKKSACYSMQDAIDGIIALGFSELSDEGLFNTDGLPIIFNFGDSLKSVEDKLMGVSDGFFEFVEIKEDSDNDEANIAEDGEDDEDIKSILNEYDEEEEESIEDDIEEEEGNLLVYIKPLYKEQDGTYVYDFLFSDTSGDVWGQGWDVWGPNTNLDSTPDDTTYSKIYRVKSQYRFKTIQETTSYTLEYATYGAIALGFIDINNLEEYPECGRCVFHFNDNLHKVEDIVKRCGGTIEEI